jgi:selenocysteine-specific elongation factor
VHAEVLAQLQASLREYFQKEKELSFGQFRELTGLSRKLGIPLLEYLDQTGVTERQGDNRRAGPKLTGRT